MSEIVIQPSIKLIRCGYWACFFVFAIVAFVYANNQAFATMPAYILLAPALLFLWPAKRHVRRRFIRMTIAGDKLRYESGIFSKTMRTIQLTKVQDVRVDQSFPQRLLGLGTLSIETAGETSRLTIENIDRPQAVAEQIIDAAHLDARKDQKL